MVLSYAATMENGEDKKQILIADVKRAYFYALAKRLLYIELPKEDELGGPGMLGKLRFNLYGTRDGASNWQEHLATHTWWHADSEEGSVTPVSSGTKKGK